jgi:short-subunit dehydrogenase
MMLFRGVKLRTTLPALARNWVNFTPQMKDFSGKVIWITGASSGIGEALAREAAARGARVVLSARKTEQLNRVLETIHGNGWVLPLDLEKDQARFPAMVQQVLSLTNGQLDVLINNGGVSQRSLGHETSLEVDRTIMEVNYFGQIALTKAVLPHMMAHGKGHIVVMSSIAGKLGFFLRTAYSASKHALHGFFDSLRLELHAHGIQVLLVCPGKVQTPISLRALTGEGKAFGQMDRAQETGVSAEYTAQAVLNAILQGKHEVYIGGKEILAVSIKRFFPRLLHRILLKQKVQ